MGWTETGATVVEVMKRRRRQSGQAVIEYAFLLILLATISFAVLILAGTQLRGAFQDVSYELTHLTDTTTVAADGTTLSPGVTPATNTCGSGQHQELRGHKWKCKDNN
jgi:Flp pilus assembly pilin Flp